MRGGKSGKLDFQILCLINPIFIHKDFKLPYKTKKANIKFLKKYFGAKLTLRQIYQNTCLN